MTTSTTNNTITIPATGTYEVTYSGSYELNATGLNLVYFQLFENGSDFGNNGELRSRINTTSTSSNEIESFHRSFIAEFTASDVLELYYQRFAGSATEIDFFNLNFSVKRLK
ncbi:MAG: hypothetical protein IPN10_03055 [Saprospiraceae bacterium]|nr:hypothetical protein [Saprospiraceae bacterium]